MIAPRRLVRHRDLEYAITQLGEAWVIEVAGGKYFLTAGDDPERQAREFVSRLPKNSLWPHTPGHLATPRFPLLLEVDGVIVRAYPAVLNREDPPKTYVHPQWAHRVTAVGDQPVWMFAARGREASAGAVATSSQALRDVEQLAREWLG